MTPAERLMSRIEIVFILIASLIIVAVAQLAFSQEAARSPRLTGAGVFVPEGGSQVRTANHQRRGVQVILPQPLFQNVEATNQPVRTDRRVPNTPSGDQSMGNTVDSGSARGNLIFAPLFQARQDTGSDNEGHRRGKGLRPVGDASRENLDEPPNRLPDLCVYSVQLSSSKPCAGQVLQARAVIFNQGTRGVEGAKVRFYLGNRPVGEERVGIPARGEEAVTVKFRAAGEGEQALRVIADPENEIAESNERNNKGFAEFVCQPVMQMAVQPKGNWPEHVDMGKVTKAVPPKYTCATPCPDLVCSVYAPNGIYNGDGLCTWVKVENKGTAPAKGLFRVGLRGAPMFGTPGMLVGIGVVNDVMNPGASSAKMVKVATNEPWTKGAADLVVEVDCLKEINEGPDGGENNNLSNKFNYVLSATPQPYPVVINNMYIPNAKCMPGQPLMVIANVECETSWEVYYAHDNGTGGKVAGAGGEFPGAGVPLPMPWPPNQPLTSNYVDVQLRAYDNNGNQDAKTIRITRTKPFDGTLKIMFLYYDWQNNDSNTRNIVTVYVGVQAITNSEFEFGDFGKPVYGSLYVTCSINSKDWVNKPGGNYASVYDIVDKPLLTEMNKPDITYSVNGAWGHKLVCPAGVIKPVNGKAEFVLSFKTQCAGPVQGAGAYYGDSLAQAIQPTISVQVVAQTPSGPANVSSSIKVPDACLEKKDLTVYGN